MNIFRMSGMVAALIAVTTAASWAADLKIGYINSERIFREYAGTKEAQEKFDKEVAKWEQQASKMQKEIKEMQDQLEKQSLLLSADRKKELEGRLAQRYAEYQKFLQEKLGNEGDAVKKNVELTKPIIDRINTILDKIAKEENYDFIFDARSGSVVFAKKNFDLTDRVIKILNTEK